MSTLLRRAALALLLVPAACTASPRQRVPLPPQDVTVSRDDLTRIYFVRTGWVGVNEGEVEVFEQDTPIGTLTSGTYLCWERAPGRTLGRAFYRASGPRRGEVEGIADLDCQAGRAHYFEVTVAREDGKPTVTALDPEEGRKLVAARRPPGMR